MAGSRAAGYTRSLTEFASTGDASEFLGTFCALLRHLLLAIRVHFQWSAGIASGVALFRSMVRRIEIILRNSGSRGNRTKRGLQPICQALYLAVRSAPFPTPMAWDDGAPLALGLGIPRPFSRSPGKTFVGSKSDLWICAIL
jgi:hypothetical protein